MDDATQPAVPGRPWGRIAIALVVAAAIVVGAVAMTGPRPRPIDAGLPTTPPPFVVPDEPTDPALNAAAARLAAGDLDVARAAFTDIVARDQAGEPGQVGLILARWRSTGPRSVERDLAQLASEYPDSAYVAFHLGLAQLLLDDARVARQTLRTARDLGIAASDPTSHRIATLADNALHPKLPTGPLPVLVQGVEVRPADRRAVTGLTAAVASGDRATVTTLARALAQSPDPFARLAAEAARFDKDDPGAAIDALGALARDGSIPPAARDRAYLLNALADRWGGGDRQALCERLLVSSGAGIDPQTRRLAAPIHAELCRA